MEAKKSIRIRCIGTLWFVRLKVSKRNWIKESGLVRDSMHSCQ